MLPTRLKFTLGGFNTECHEVEWQAGKLRYRRAEVAYLWKPATELSPSPEAWTTFWRTADAAGIWRLQKDYQNAEVCDGLQWSLRLEYQDRRVHSEGSNFYPGSPGPEYSPTGEFAHFLRALRNLTGQESIN